MPGFGGNPADADSGLVMVDLAFWDDFLQTKSVVGQLWDNHFRQLGHPPKFYRVQDASSGNNSPFWNHFNVILMNNHPKITQYHVFSKKWLKKKKCQDAYKQSSGVGMHQHPYFQLKPITNWKNLEIRIPSTIAIPESALFPFRRQHFPRLGWCQAWVSR